MQLSFTLVSEIPSPGTVTLSIQDQSRLALLASKLSADIAARGEATLQAAFVVPENASSIQILVAFQPTDASATKVALILMYLTE